MTRSDIFLQKYYGQITPNTSSSNSDFHYYSLCVIVRSAVNSCLFLISVNVFFSFVRFFFIFSDSLLEFSWCLPIFSSSAAANAAKSLQSCLTLCDPIDGSPPGSPIPGILQARTLEWVAISFSQVALVVKNLSAKSGDTRDMGAIPG